MSLFDSKELPYQSTSEIDYPALVGKTVGFIIHSERKGKFYPRVATVVDMPDDHDAILNVVGTQPATESLDAARACFAEGGDAGLTHVFLNPISPGLMGTWLSELLASEKV